MRERHPTVSTPRLEGAQSFSPHTPVTTSPPRYSVPARDTTYTCAYVDLADFADDPEPLHLVGFRANIDNIRLMHHVLMYVCEEPPSEDAFARIKGRVYGTGCTEAAATTRVKVRRGTPRRRARREPAAGALTR